MHVSNTFLLMLICILSFYSSSVFGSDWRKVNNPETLEKIFSDTRIRGVNFPHSNFEYNKLNTQWHIDYCSDGTGVLTFWNESYPRTWKIKGQDQVCVIVHSEEKCYFYEEHIEYLDVYRAGIVGMRDMPWVFIVNNQKPEICD